MDPGAPGRGGRAQGRMLTGGSRGQTSSEAHSVREEMSALGNRWAEETFTFHTLKTKDRETSWVRPTQLPEEKS